jgi:flagellar protein FlaG
MPPISVNTNPPPRPVAEAAEPARAAASQKPVVRPNKAAVTTLTETGADMQAMRQEMKQALERLNQQASKDGRKLNFSMDEVADRMVITVRKTETGEVIRQIPDEAVLRVAHNIEELKGLLHNKMI